MDATTTRVPLGSAPAHNFTTFYVAGEDSYSPCIKKILNSCLIIGSTVFFTVSLSTLVGYAIGASLILSAEIGALSGFIMGFVLALLSNDEVSEEVKRRQDRLSEFRACLDSTVLEKKIEPNADILDAVERVREVFTHETPFFQMPFDYTALHCDLTKITDWTCASNDPRLTTIWNDFLERELHGCIIRSPDGRYHEFKTDVLLSRSHGINVSIDVASLSLDDLKKPEVYNQICDIQYEAFGDAWKQTSMLNEVANGSALKDGSGCIVAKNKHSQQIVGFLFFGPEAGHPEHIRVLCCGRRPEVSRCGVGVELMTAFLTPNSSHFKNLDLDKIRISLHVRKSNVAAIELYKSFEFKNKGGVSSYYTGPSEDAYTFGRPLLIQS